MAFSFWNSLNSERGVFEPSQYVFYSGSRMHWILKRESLSQGIFYPHSGTHLTVKRSFWDRVSFILILEHIEQWTRNLWAKHCPLCGYATPPPRQPGYFKYFWRYKNKFSSFFIIMKSSWPGQRGALPKPSILSPPPPHHTNIITNTAIDIKTIMITTTNLPGLDKEKHYPLPLTSKLMIIISTWSGQTEALPKPSILSLRMPRTEEKGLWPIWKWQDDDGCDSQCEDGNDEDDLDDYDC